MKLLLDPLDLKPEYQNGQDQTISTRFVTFETLNEKAQQAVKAVGRGIFFAWDRQTYNAVYPSNDSESMITKTQYELLIEALTAILDEYGKGWYFTWLPPGFQPTVAQIKGNAREIINNMLRASEIQVGEDS